MPTPKPLTRLQAQHSLANRLGARVDRIRQLSTRFGVRPYRVFLVWTRWSGSERGAGEESVFARFELLPTPRVMELTGVGYRPWSAGTFPEGTVRVDRVSTLFTADNLKGLVIPRQLPLDYCCCPSTPDGTPVAGTLDRPMVAPQVDFFWEIHEDGRGDEEPERLRFRLFSRVTRDAGNAQWVAMLESASDPLDRQGKPKIDQLPGRFDADDT